MLKFIIGVLKAVGAIAPGAMPLWHLTTNSAQAVTLTYSMTVDVAQGNYQGTYQGEFSYDSSNLLQTCPDNSAFTCATVKQNNLSVLFNFLGKAYSEKQDVDYTLGFPAVYFQGDTLAGLSLVVTPPAADTSFSILGKSFHIGFGIYPDALTGQGLAGSVSYKLQLPPLPPASPLPPAPLPQPIPSCPENCESVPEPSEMAGGAFAIALLGLGLKLRRNR